MIQIHQLRYDHIDTHYTFALFRYLKKLAINIEMIYD